MTDKHGFLFCKICKRLLTPVMISSNIRWWYIDSNNTPSRLNDHFEHIKIQHHIKKDNKYLEIYDCNLGKIVPYEGQTTFANRFSDEDNEHT